MGSKNRLAKHLLPIILKDRQPGQWYVEPFVGGGNMIDKVDGNRIGADCNNYVVQALVSIRDNIDELPKHSLEFTEQDYTKLRREDSYKHKGYAGFAFSYGGKWLGGWRRDGIGKRDYVREAYDNAVKQSERLTGALLINDGYNSLSIPNRSIIYCDPPYSGTTKYSDNFDHEEFWQWCRDKVSEGHKVFISEYTSPDDFVCVFSKEQVSSLTRDTGSKVGIEKLFVHESQAQV